MKKFNDFNIKIECHAFTGDKIKVSKILNREITVQDFKIEPSKHNNGNCLYLQIKLNQTNHVVFTGSTVLMEQIKLIPSNGFPFITTIVEENDRFLFT